jgi:nucleotide-binding universal stress UspA family protein
VKILLPIDGSPLSLDAVHHAMRLVREGLRATFVLANVQEPSSLYEWWWCMTPSRCDA